MQETPDPAILANWLALAQEAYKTNQPAVAQAYERCHRDITNPPNSPEEET